MNNLGEQDGYKWEYDIAKLWKDLKDPNLEQLIQTESKKKTEKLEYLSQILSSEIDNQSPIIRFLLIIVDQSEGMREIDMKPNRYTVTQQYLQQFIIDFYDNNPLSQLAIVATKHMKTHIVSNFSNSPEYHNEELKNSYNLGGEPTLANSLDLGMDILKNQGDYGHKEILIIWSNIKICDPDIKALEGMRERLISERIQVNGISLSGELSLCKNITEITGGWYKIIEEECELDIALKMLGTNQYFKGNEHEERTEERRKSSCDLIRMGFPTLRIEQTASLCVCHNALKYLRLECPRCRSKHCWVPAICQVCGLMLVSSAHLARTAHHKMNTLQYIYDRTNQHIDKCLGCSLSTHCTSLCHKCNSLFCLYICYIYIYIYLIGTAIYLYIRH